MRHSVTGLVLGIVIGSVIAGGAAFALGGDAPLPTGTPAADAAPAIAQARMGAGPSVVATPSVETTRPVEPPVATPRPEVVPPAVCDTTAFVENQTHTEVCVNTMANEQVCQPAAEPMHDAHMAPAPSGTEPATTASSSHRMGGHDSGPAHE